MKKFVLAVTLLAATASAFADWAASLRSGTYTATMNYGPTAYGPTTGIAVTEAMTSTGQPTGPIGQFAAGVLTLQPKMRAYLDSWGTSSAQQNGASFSSGGLSGILTASISGLTGASTGQNRFTFSGPTYSASFSKSSSVYGLFNASCTVNVTLTNVSISVVYNAYNGVIDPAQSSMTYGSTSNTSCSSDIDWIPILGSTVNNFIAGKVNTGVLGMMSSLQSSAVNLILPYGPQYLGINTAIASGRYIFNGVDWGAYIKNNFASLFTGKSLSLKIGQPIIETLYVYGTSAPNQYIYDNTPFQINFSDSAQQLLFTISSRKIFNYKWRCPAGTRSGCPEP